MCLDTSPLQDALSVEVEVVEVAVNPLCRTPDQQRFQYEFVLEARRRPELRDEAVALYEGYNKALEQAFVRRGHSSTKTLARAIFAALDGLVLQQWAVADEEAVRGVMERVGKLLKVEVHVPLTPAPMTLEATI